MFAVQVAIDWNDDAQWRSIHLNYVQWISARCTTTRARGSFSIDKKQNCPAQFLLKVTVLCVSSFQQTDSWLGIPILGVPIFNETTVVWSCIFTVRSPLTTHFLYHPLIQFAWAAPNYSLKSISLDSIFFLILFLHVYLCVAFNWLAFEAVCFYAICWMETCIFFLLWIFFFPKFYLRSLRVECEKRNSWWC